MAETISISESDGVAMLRGALKRALPGTVISLDSGTFPLDAPLFVPSGTTVQGAGSDQTVFTQELDGPAIVVRHAQNVRLADFAVYSRMRGNSRLTPPDDPAATGAASRDVGNEWGVLFIDDARAIDLERISLAGQREEENLKGLVARDSTEVSIIKSQIQSFGRSGIALFGTEETIVASCRVTNCLNGVVLAVMANSQRTSRAVLESNRCHDNTQAGIVFSSSESDTVRDNDCWGNGGSGIILVRDEYAPDQPSRAILEGNRCHDNTGYGIAFFSSESEAVRDNDCWGNALSGIILARDRDTPDQPSRTVLEGNRCHDNTEAGIAVLSSESEAVRDNDCWANGRSGITLARDEKAPDQPSRALLEGNRCFRNRESFAIEIGSEARAIGNIVFENREAATYIGPDGNVLHPLDWDLIVAPETEDQTRARLRGKLSSGPLSRRLEAAGVTAPDILLRFLRGHGALDDLKRWLGKNPLPPPETTPEEPPEVGVFRYAGTEDPASGSEAVLRFTSVSKQKLRDLVWDIAAGHVLQDQRGTYVIGAFGQLEDEITCILSEAAEVNAVDVDTGGKDLPTGRLDLLRGLTISGVRVARPLVFDCSARSEDALAQRPPPLPFLEPSPPRGPRLLRDWLAFVVGSPRLMGSLLLGGAVSFAISVVVGGWKGFPAPTSDPVGAAFFALKAYLDDYQLFDILFIPVVLPAGLFALVAWINQWVPQHLALRLRDRSDPARPRRKWPWRAWVRRRVFRGGRISLVVLKDQQEWHDEDRSAFRELIEMRPKDATLVVVIAAPTRAILDRSLLRSLSGSGGRLELPVDVELLACLGPEPKPIAIEKVSDAHDIAPLLGLDGTSQATRLEMAKSSILSPGLSVSDLIPMVVLGSTHLHTFEITRIAEGTFARFGPEFQKMFDRYARVFSVDPKVSIDLSRDVESLNRWIEEARHSSACVLMRRTEARETRYRVLGRYQRRFAILAALQSDPDVFGQDRDSLVDYLHGMLACGQVHALENVRTFLGGNGSEPHLNRAFFALYSAVLLRREAEDLNTSSSVARSVMIASEWDETIAALDTLKIPAPSTKDFELARLHAISRHVRSGEDQDRKAAAEAAFDTRVARAVAKFESLDRDLAYGRAKAELFPLLKILPAQDRDRLSAQLDLRRRRGLTLADLLTTSADENEMRHMLARHAALPDEGALSTLISTSARAISTEDEAIRLGVLLESIRERLSAFPPFARTHGYSRSKFAEPYRLLELASMLLANPDKLAVPKPDGPNSTSQIELMYGNFDHLFDGTRDLTRIEIREA